MLIILLTWICITVVVYPIGVLLHSLLQRAFKMESAHEHFTLCCISGLLVTNFISTLLCFFIPLGLASNLVVLLVAVTGFVTSRRSIYSSVARDLRRLRDGHWSISLLVFLCMIIMSYLAYLPSSHHDDGLYYSTTIKWLQEYGTVKGLANVNPRIGFNSNWHILQANLGFRYLNAGLFNDLNGLLFVWMLLYAAGGINNLRKKDYSVQNCIRVLILLPILPFHFEASSEVLLYNVNFISSSSADLPVCLITWLIFLLFIKTNGHVHDFHFTDVLVVLYSAWALSIKLSVLPIILLSLYMVTRLISAGKFRQSVLLALVAVVFVLPWLVRNVLVSGYLVFPFAAIDIFPVVWKVPVAQVEEHANSVRLFAIGANLEQPFDQAFLHWFPRWFSEATTIQQISLWTVLAATLSYLVIAVRHVHSGSAFFFKSRPRVVVCLATCLAGIVFWLNLAPDFRFGYGFICFYDVFFIALICRLCCPGCLRHLFLAAALYMAAVIILYYNDRWMSARLIFGKPIPYRMPSAMKQIPLPGKQSMNIVSQEDSWNAPLPVANAREFDVLRPGLLGRTIQQGFKANVQGD